MIDIHTHIIPGVDDGVQDPETAVEFARMAAADGIRTMVATPHCKEGFYDNDLESVTRDVKSLKKLLREEQVDIELLPGAEVHICPDLVNRIRDGRAVTLGNNGKTVLLELSLTQYPVELENLVFQLKLAGLDVIFAHPERVRFFQDDISRYEAVIRQGAYGQITTGSILGTFGSSVRRFSEELLGRGLVHILASDAHGLRGRPPVLSEARHAVASLVGEAVATSMVDHIPRALLEGREPLVPEVQSPAGRSKVPFWARLFGKD